MTVDVGDATEAGYGDAGVQTLDTSTLGVLQRAEIDVAVSTAKRYPRKLPEAFMKQVLSLVALNEDVAESCLYSLERKGADGKVAIEGPSIRMAEIVMHAWGNCRVMGRVIDDGGEFVVGQGVFIDLECNVTVSKEVRRRVTTREGRRYSADMVGVTAMAAVSIATRNAVFGGIPQPLWIGAYEKAREVAVGTYETLEARRAKLLKWLADPPRGITEDRVFAALEVGGAADIDLDRLGRLRGLVASVKNGEQRPEDAFPVVGAAATETAPRKGTAALRDKLAPPDQGGGVRTGDPAPRTPDPPPARTPDPTPAKPPGGKKGARGKDAAPGQGGPAPAPPTAVKPMCSRCTNESTVMVGDVPYCPIHQPSSSL